MNIYGIPGEYQATSSYTIDGTHATSHTEPPASDQTYPSLLFSASALGNGSHTIKVTFDHSNNTPADGDSEHRCFSFEYLTYMPSDRSIVGFRRDSDKNDQSRHNGQGHGRRNDMIVGIVLASLAAVLACIAAFWFWRRYRKMKRMLAMVTGKDAEYGGGNNKGPSVVGALDYFFYRLGDSLRNCASHTQRRVRRV